MDLTIHILADSTALVSHVCEGETSAPWIAAILKCFYFAEVLGSLNFKRDVDLSASPSGRRLSDGQA